VDKDRIENLTRISLFIFEGKFFLVASIRCQVMITITHMTQIWKVPAFDILASYKICIDQGELSYENARSERKGKNVGS
jgi:hypothetical protein